MSKRITIQDEHTREVEFDEQVDGGFSLQYTKNTDDGKIHVLGQINNGKYGPRHWIKNYEYVPLAEKLVAKFEELEHIDVRRILFIEDHVSFENKTPTGKPWVVQVKKAAKELIKLWGYWYVFEIRQHLFERKSPEQRIALFYHELKHVGSVGELETHDIEDWTDLVNTLGQDWENTDEMLWNILDDNFSWGQKPRINRGSMPYIHRHGRENTTRHHASGEHPAE